jgi:hypothetical protein
VANINAPTNKKVIPKKVDKVTPKEKGVKGHSGSHKGQQLGIT